MFIECVPAFRWFVDWYNYTPCGRVNQPYGLWLDTIIQRLYGDNVLGKLPGERYIKLSQDYEQEQKDLKGQVGNLSKQVNEQEQQSVNAEQFIRLIRKQTDVTALTPTVLHELVDRIEVHAPDKSSGKRVQEITIYLSFIGATAHLR